VRRASAGPAPGFLRKPDYSIEVRAAGRRSAGLVGGITAVDSGNALLLLEEGYAPVWYFPRADVRMDLLTPTATVTHCPFKGDAGYWSVSTPAGTRRDAAWSYETPFEEMVAIAGRIAFYWDALDHWSEDGAECSDTPSLSEV
jgi:uncharacterized protein (DUF427 family)